MKLGVDFPPELLEAVAERAAELVLERQDAEGPPASPFVSVPEAAEILRCERQRVYDLLSQRRLSRFKEGSRTLLDRAEVLALVREETRRRVAAILDEASSFHFLTRSRGFSKTTDLAGVAVAVLLAQAPAGSRSYGVASDQAQARLLLDAIGGFVARTSALTKLLEVQSSRVVCVRSGASLDALAADEAGAWGLRPFFAVVDELTQWGSTAGPRRIWDAVTSAIPKTDGRLVVLTTAGDPAHWSRKVLDHALADDLWRVSEVAGPPPWMPVRLVEEQRRRLLDSTFRRLFENQWVSSEDRLVSAEDLSACVVLDGPLPWAAGHPYVIGVDVGLKRDRTVAAVCHAERMAGSETGVRVVLDRLGVWQGSKLRAVKLDTVEEWVAKAAHDYRASVIVDPYQAVAMAQRLRERRGVRVEEFSFGAQSVGRLAANLHLLLREHALALPDDPELLDELANVRLRETSPGVVRMDHDADRHDDRAIALGLAALRLVSRPMGPSRATIGRPSGRMPVAGRLGPIGESNGLDRLSELTGLTVYDSTKGQR